MILGNGFSQSLLNLQTFDRPHIEKWLNEGNQKCPVTQNVLAHTVLIPNVLVHDMISEWCREHNVELSKCADVSDQVWTEFDTHNVNSLIQKMSSTLSERKEAARELRLLTKKSSSLRSAIGETDVIPLLLSTLKWDIVKTDYQFQEDLITTLLNLAIHVDNKGKIVDNPLAIPLLIEYLKSGAMETRRNAAATLFTLARTESSKNLIGQAGALKPLLDLVEEGNALAMKDALQAIVHLCTESNNKVTAVREGAIRVILKMITDDVLVEELAILLTAVASQEESIQEFEKLNAIPKLLGVIRNSNCLRVKEHCVSILYHICSKDPTKLADIRSDERANSTFSMLLLSEETDRTKRKVKDIISRIKKASGSSSSSSPRSLS